MPQAEEVKVGSEVNALRDDVMEMIEDGTSLEEIIEAYEEDDSLQNVEDW